MLLVVLGILFAILFTNFWNICRNFFNLFDLLNREYINNGLWLIRNVTITGKSARLVASCGTKYEIYSNVSYYNFIKSDIQ